MLFAATPEQQVPGVPPLTVLERSGQVRQSRHQPRRQPLRSLGSLGSLGFDWSVLTNLIKPASEVGLQVVGTRYGVPQLQQGTVIQQTPQGTLMLAQPAGVPVQTPYPASTSTTVQTSWGTGAMIAGAAVLVAVVVIMTQKK